MLSIWNKLKFCHLEELSRHCQGKLDFGDNNYRILIIPLVPFLCFSFGVGEGLVSMTSFSASSSSSSFSSWSLGGGVPRSVLQCTTVVC